MNENRATSIVSLNNSGLDGFIKSKAFKCKYLLH